MEHGGQHQNRVAFLDRKAVDRTGRQRMQIGRFLAVRHAFGITRCAAGVTNAGGRIFFWYGPIESITGALDHRLIVHRAGVVQLFALLAGPHHNHVLHRRNHRQYGLEGLDQSAIKQHETVCRVLDDVSDVLRGQSAIQGV